MGGGDSRSRTPQPAQASRGTLRQPRRLGRPAGTPPIPAGTHMEPWDTRKPGSHEQTLRACAWGEGVTPPARPLAHSLHAWPAARPASASSAPRVLRPPWRGCPTSRRRSGRRGSRSRSHPPVLSVGIASAGDSSPAPSTAQTRVMLRHQESSPELGLPGLGQGALQRTDPAMGKGAEPLRGRLWGPKL